MSISRRALYAAGEPLGDSATRRETGRIVCGGGGGSSKSSTASTTNYNVEDRRLSTAEGSIGLTGDGSSITAIDGRQWLSSFTQNTNLSDSRQWNSNDSRQWHDNSTTNVTSVDPEIAKAAFDFAKASDAVNGDSFDRLVGMAEGLFERGENMIALTQDRVADAYAAAGAQVIDQAGRIDQKTMIVLAGLAVAGLAMWGRK